MNFNPYILQQMMRGGVCMKPMPQARPSSANLAYLQKAHTKRGGVIIIKVTNSNKDEARPYVILDALGFYQKQTNIDFPNSDVTIEGLSKDYDVILRHLLDSRWKISAMNMEVSAGTALEQFDRSISIYKDEISAAAPQLMQTLYPSMGLNSYQQQNNRVELPVNLTFASHQAITGLVEPKSTLIFRIKVDYNVQLR